MPTITLAPRRPKRSILPAASAVAVAVALVLALAA